MFRTSSRCTRCTDFGSKECLPATIPCEEHPYSLTVKCQAYVHSNYVRPRTTALFAGDAVPVSQTPQATAAREECWGGYILFSYADNRDATGPRMPRFCRTLYGLSNDSYCSILHASYSRHSSSAPARLVATEVSLSGPTHDNGREPGVLVACSPGKSAVCPRRQSQIDVSNVLPHSPEKHNVGA